MTREKSRQFTVSGRFARALMIVSAALAPALAFSGYVSVKVIYGDDDRLDIHQVSDANLLRLADSTVALFKTDQVIGNVRGTYDLVTESYGSGRHLCREERFFEQEMGAFCSGALVGKDLILTAGHCIESQSDCESTKFVFGFAVRAPGELPRQADANDVYGCGRLVDRAQEHDGADWALIQLDRPVENHAPLEISRRKEKIARGTELVMIGHPSGLPTKIAAGAAVREVEDEYFVANTDSYGGNSGSAVFNARTGLIEGVLVRGERDYEYDGSRGCVKSVVCKNDGCRGEDITDIMAFADRIP